MKCYFVSVEWDVRVKWCQCVKGWECEGLRSVMGACCHRLHGIMLIGL